MEPMNSKIYVWLSIVFLLFSLLPMFYELSRANDLQPNRYFELVHNFPTDFNFYLSRIRQGLEGHLTVVEKYTSEPHQGSFLHVFYLAMGWVGRWVRVPWHRTSDIYHVARAILGLTLLIMVAEFCKKSFLPSKKSAAEVANENLDPSSVSLAGAWHAVIDRSSRSQSEAGQNFVRSPRRIHAVFRIYPLSIIAFVLAVTASTYPKLVSVVDTQVVSAALGNIWGWRIGGYMAWWSVMDSLQRITFIPHLVAGQALIVFFMMALGDRATMSRPGNWMFLGILMFLLGIIFPPGYLFVATAAVVLVIIECIYDLPSMGKSLLPRFIGQTVISRAVVVLMGVPSLLYLVLMTSFYPWKRLVEFDILHPLPFDYIEYIKAVGPVLPLGLLGIFVALRHRDRSMLPSVAWVGAWIVLLVVFKFIPQQSPLRFSEMIPHVPLAILAVWFFYNGYNRYKRSILLVLPIGLVALGLAHMYSSFLWQRDFVDHKIRASFPLVPTGSFVMYPLKDFVSAIRYIQDSTTRDTVVLSETGAGNYIPVYSGNTVYVGHDNTVAAEEKKVLVTEFFRGRMNARDAYGWIQKEGIGVVFFGPQEQEDGLLARLDPPRNDLVETGSAKRVGEAGGLSDILKVYPFLKEVYKNTYVTVYTVSNF